MYAIGDAPFRVTSTTLPGGDRGTRKTLSAMQRLALEAASQLEVRGNAIAALRMSGAQPHDKLAEAQALFDFVRERIRFTSDPTTTEFVQSPRYTLSVMAGDCDDMATLLAAMLHSVGIPARFKAIATDRRRPGTFSHVYVVARVNGRDVAMDPIYRSNALGYQFPHPFRSAEVPV